MAGKVVNQTFEHLKNLHRKLKDKCFKNRHAS